MPAIRVSRKHEELAAFLAPEERGRRIAPGDTLEGSDPVQTHSLVLRLHYEHRRS